MSIPSQMSALQQTSFQGPEHMNLVRDVPVPLPGPGEILIRVVAAGVNFADISRSYGSFKGGPLPPYRAGFEASGEVVAAGPGVDTPSVGSFVVGVGSGAFAEYATLYATGAVLVPPGWTPQQAMGLVVNWPTAVAAVESVGELDSGETVLIHAAAGATGQAAVMLAKHRGARVIATASPHKHEQVRALGADYVLNSRADDWSTEVQRLTQGVGADLVLESGGGATFKASLAAARRVKGRVVVFGLAGGEATLSNWELVYEQQVHVIGLNIGVLMRAAPQLFGDVMGRLFGLVAAGVVLPTQPTTYSLKEGRRALLDLQSRVTSGKLALLP